VLIGALVFTPESTLDPDRVAVDVLNNDVVEALLFGVRSRAEALRLLAPTDAALFEEMLDVDAEELGADADVVEVEHRRKRY
jgi:hypothetical protein